MVDFQYTNVPGKITKILDKIRSVGVPPKATNAWLKSIGFSSSNDSTLLPVLKAIGFAEASGTPTALWRDYRGKDDGAVLAAGIRQGYGELFGTYPEAWKNSKEDLAHYFSTKSSAGEQVIDLTVRTFQNLCAKADFSARRPSDRNEASEAGDSESKLRGKTRRQSAPSLHIDIQIHVSPDASADQIDQMFKSMAKHLYRE